MRVRMIDGGKTRTVSAVYGQRLIAAGKAVLMRTGEAAKAAKASRKGKS